MHINVTFLIQIVNFWATYFFLKKILLNPVVTVLLKRKNAHRRLSLEFKKKEDFLKQRVDEKSRLLRAFQRQLKERYQIIKLECPEIPSQIAYVKDQGEIDQVVSRGKDLLVRNILHACR